MLCTSGGARAFPVPFHAVPNAQASNVRAQPFNSTACLVTWEPVEDTREAVNGKLGGYRVSEERGAAVKRVVRNDMRDCCVRGGQHARFCCA